MTTIDLNELSDTVLIAMHAGLMRASDLVTAHPNPDGRLFDELQDVMEQVL